MENDLKDASTHWPEEDNDCGRSDSVSFTSSYGGRRSQAVNIANDATCLTGDDTSMVGFGTLPSIYVAYTCTWTMTGGLIAYESDARLNKVDADWTTDADTGCNQEYIVDNVVSHERGHTFGEDDITGSSHSNLTMYSTLYWCQTKAETLGLGDMLRLENMYG